MSPARADTARDMLVCYSSYHATPHVQHARLERPKHEPQQAGPPSNHPPPLFRSIDPTPEALLPALKRRRNFFHPRVLVEASPGAPICPLHLQFLVLARPKGWNHSEFLVDDQIIARSRYRVVIVQFHSLCEMKFDWLVTRGLVTLF
ncbi:hypothetical protein RRG08_014947 [Elysia crispata]|uniref:Uncharacterized protein n=1 Tax=Elysia crispata TaxID=231223 RepID=A0AAE1EDB9_9GAST|nr:hypothetical protein RRG08_014947 [Elysia crispata]